MISSLKAMVIIFWSLLGFAVIQALPPKVTFTSEFCVDAVLPHAVATKRADDPSQWLVLHMDSASAYGARLPARNLEENRIIASPHPAFSPNLAPSVVVSPERSEKRHREELELFVMRKAAEARSKSPNKSPRKQIRICDSSSIAASTKAVFRSRL
jgi:hypothetical protein